MPVQEVARSMQRKWLADSMAKPEVVISFWSRARPDRSVPKPVPADLNFATSAVPCRHKRAAEILKQTERPLAGGPCTPDQAACSFAFRKMHRSIWTRTPVRGLLI